MREGVMSDPGPDFIKAFVALQKELPAVRKSASNPHFKSKFAPLDEVNPAVIAVLTRHGFAWATMPCVLADGSPGLRYMLMHESGDMLTDAMPLLKASTPQEQGSAITYARRYSIQAVTGVVTDEDDDGNAASRPPQQRPKQQPRPAQGEASTSAAAAPSAPQSPRQALWAYVQGIGWNQAKLNSEFARWSSGVVLDPSVPDDQVQAFLIDLRTEAAA
jgi:hypothetical protein